MQDVRARQEREAKQRGMVHDVMCCAVGRRLEGRWCSVSPLLCVGRGRLTWDALRLRRKELVVQWTKTKSDPCQLGSFSGVILRPPETSFLCLHLSSLSPRPSVSFSLTASENFERAEEDLPAIAPLSQKRRCTAPGGSGCGPRDDPQAHPSLGRERSHALCARGGAVTASSDVACPPHPNLFG